MIAQKCYTVVCPGIGRYEEAQRKQMSKDDKHLHHGSGWYSNEFPTTCPNCGDPAQPRGMHWVIDLNREEASDNQVSIP